MARSKRQGARSDAVTHEGFLRPLPGSPLAGGGAGGGYPKYVGAFAPAVDGAGPTSR